MYLSIYLTVALSLCSSFWLSVCLSVALSLCRSVSLSLCSSFRLSVCPSVCLSICLSAHHSDCLSVRQSVCLSVWCNSVAAAWSCCLALCVQSPWNRERREEETLLWNIHKAWPWGPEAHTHNSSALLLQLDCGTTVSALIHYITSMVRSVRPSNNLFVCFPPGTCTNSLWGSVMHVCISASWRHAPKTWVRAWFKYGRVVFFEFLMSNHWFELTWLPCMFGSVPAL